MTYERRGGAVSALIGGLLLSGTAFAGGNIEVREEVVVRATPAMVWSLVGDYNGLHDWHPAVVETQAEGDGTGVGQERVLVLGNGATIKETLEGHDASAMRYSYAIIESPLPVADYQASITVERTDRGFARVVWSSSFNAKGASDEEAEGVISGIYRAGFDALLAHF